MPLVRFDRVLTVLLALTLASAVGGNSAAQTPPAGKIPSAVEELLWWLPPDTETVQVTQTPDKPAHGPLFDGMEFVRGEIGIGDVSYADILVQHLRTARIKATVDGARRFRPPSGLGSTLYEGALIILFERPLPDGRALIAALVKNAVKVEEIQGVTTVEFRDTLESDMWTSFIATPRPDVLVVAYDRHYLDELLRRRRTRTGARALPNNLPEWRWVDPNAPFWALRHFRRDGAGADPTSPFAKDRSFSLFDPDAIGVTTHATSDGDTIIAHYVSAAKNAEEIARRMWHRPGDGVTPVFHRVSDDAVEARFNARDEEHLSMFLFYLLASLGHATYV